MSGYRNIHREKGEPESSAVWSVQVTNVLCKAPSPLTWRIWTATADGLVRSYFVRESSIDSKKDSLDASALKLVCTHELGGQETTSFGCTRVSVTRNYVGSDDRSGDLIVASLGLAGKVSIWKFSETFDEGKDYQEEEEGTKRIKPLFEFQVSNATGTTLQLRPPRVSGVGDVAVAVGLLDGTIAILATGLTTPNAQKEAKEAGTILDIWGSNGSSIPLSLDWHPKEPAALAVGRQDGTVDILSTARKGHHRLSHHKGPVRAVSYTDDGQLLCTGGDDGFLAVFDVGRKTPTMAHHVLQAHKGWIMGAIAFFDSRRFATLGAERLIHVWSVDQMYQPIHTFQTDQSIWAVARGPGGTLRMVTGSDTGALQVYSLATQ